MARSAQGGSRTARPPLKIAVDLSSLNSLIAELSANAAAAIRPAAQAAAQVMYDKARANVRRIGKKTGNLERSIYQVYSKSQSNESRAVYEVSYNARTAPHGGLVEYGHIQRYVTYKTKAGLYRPLVRPEMRGKPKPGKRASTAVKDAYYVLLPAPKQVAAKPFLRPVVDHFDEAVSAARVALSDRILTP